MKWRERTEAQKQFVSKFGESWPVGTRLEQGLMDLSLLPVETTFSWSRLRKVDGYAFDTVEMAEKSGLRKVKDTSYFERDVTYLRIDNTSICTDGFNANAAALMSSPANYDANIAGHLDGMRVIDWSSISLPAKYHNRSDVNFLGLPKGTKLFTNTGGKFEVVGHDTGEEHKLDLLVHNPAAMKVVERQGWKTLNHPLGTVVIVKSNLMLRGRDCFKMEKTEFPANGMQRALDYYSARWKRPFMMVGNVGFSFGEKGSEMTFEEEMENFLFG